jgi:hypothetical protein
MKRPYTGSQGVPIEVERVEGVLMTLEEPPMAVPRLPWPAGEESADMTEQGFYLVDEKDASRAGWVARVYRVEGALLASCIVLAIFDPALPTDEVEKRVRAANLGAVIWLSTHQVTMADPWPIADPLELMDRVRVVEGCLVVEPLWTMTPLPEEST